MFIEPDTLKAVADDLVAFCATNGNEMDGAQFDVLMCHHGLGERTPRRGSKARDGHMVHRADLCRAVRSELAGRNLRFDLKNKQNGRRECVWVLRDAVEGSVERLRSEPDFVPRRAKRAMRDFTKALDLSPRFDLPEELKLRLQRDTAATVADAARILKRQYDLVIDIGIGMGRPRVGGGPQGTLPPDPA